MCDLSTIMFKRNIAISFSGFSRRLPMENTRRVVVTGLAVIAPNGIGKEAFWDTNVRGISGVTRVFGFDTSLFSSKIAGQVTSFDALDHLPRKIAKRIGRFAQLGLSSAQMAYDDARLDLTRERHERVGVVFGSGLGGVMFHEEQMLRGYEKGAHRLNPLCVPTITPNSVSSQIAIYFGINGPSLLIANACASGAAAIGEAFRKIQRNEADLMFTGGAEAPLSQFTFGAYDAMRVLSARNDKPEEASRPFDLNRDGFVLSEGSATIVLEELGHAQSRGAYIYAEIIGYASNCGAHDMVTPKPGGEDIAAAMSQALAEAGMAPSDVSYVNAHGTSTREGDRTETQGMKRAFGDHAYRISISSTKSMIGHTIGASGAIEAAVSCLSIERQTIPPTINYSDPDPECDLDYVPNLARAAPVRVVMSNSFGFGSNNVCLIFRRCDG